MRLTVLALTATTASAFLLPARLAPAAPKTLPLRASTVEPTPKDIVDTAVAAGSFKTLATALTAAGLVDTLKSAGPFTVFAPTDEAFAKIPQETLAAILADKEKLTSILTYHVVPGKVPAAEVVKVSKGRRSGRWKRDAQDRGGGRRAWRRCGCVLTPYFRGFIRRLMSSMHCTCMLILAAL